MINYVQETLFKCKTQIKGKKTGERHCASANHKKAGVAVQRPRHTSQGRPSSS